MLPAAAAVALFVVALFAVAIPRFERVLLERKKEMIRELTNEAISILREYAAEERAGRLSTGGRPARRSRAASATCATARTARTTSGSRTCGP